MIILYFIDFEMVDFFWKEIVFLKNFRNILDTVNKIVIIFTNKLYENFSFWFFLIS